MARYVDGFLIPIARSKVNQYKKIAQKAGKIWKEHGALEYYECVGDDLDIKDMLSFRKSASATGEETVIFSWIIYQSKKHRNKVNTAVMNDPRLKKMMESDAAQFDYTRMAYGGFKALVIFGNHGDC